MPKSNLQSCFNCQFRVAELCQRLPPQVTHDAANHRPYSWWPKIRLTDWCGEWKEESDGSL